MNDDKKMCQNCGERETISANNPLCASCMGKKGNASQHDKKVHDIKTTKDKGQVKITSLRPDKTVIVDFSSYPDILNQLIEMAEKEFRPIEFEIIYMMKLFFDVKQNQLSQNLSENNKPQLQ